MTDNDTFTMQAADRDELTRVEGGIDYWALGVVLEGYGAPLGSLPLVLLGQYLQRSNS